MGGLTRNRTTVWHSFIFFPSLLRPLHLSQGLDSLDTRHTPVTRLDAASKDKRDWLNPQFLRAYIAVVRPLPPSLETEYIHEHIYTQVCIYILEVCNNAGRTEKMKHTQQSLAYVHTHRRNVDKRNSVHAHARSQTKKKQFTCTSYTHEETGYKKHENYTARSDGTFMTG